MRLAIRCFAVLLLLVSATPLQAQEVTTIVLVRHAERGTDDPRNPSLSDAGRERAASLARMLADLPVQALWTTDYQRTRQTLEPLAKARSLTPMTYNPSDLKGALDRIVRESTGRTVVIAGHSNTIPPMVNMLAGSAVAADMPESEYGRIWIVHLRAGAPPIVTQLNY